MFFFFKKLFFTELYNKKIDACKIKYKKNDKIERKKKKKGYKMLI
jgi:hypothetical protein